MAKPPQAPPPRGPMGPFASALAAYEAGRFAESESACRNLLAINAGNMDALHLLALNLAALGSAEAIEVVRRALTARKKDPGLWLALGHAQARAGNRAAATEAYRGALRAAPGYVPALVSLAELHFDEGRYSEAATGLKRALDADRDGPVGKDAELWNKLGYAQSQHGRISDAVDSYRRALALDSKHLGALANLALALLERGEAGEAIAVYERAVALAPSLGDLHSNLLLALNYSADIAPREILRYHRTWNETHGKVARIAGAARAKAEGPLRLGFVSTDLRSHPVAQFLLPLLTALPRERVTVACYSATTRPDAMTEKLRSTSPIWREIAALSDEDAAKLIAADGIDLLIDLGGHTADNRLGIFARKPALLQATWLGYANTTGLDAIDLRLTDAVADPPGEADKLHSESLLRLPGCFLCYGPPEDAPPVAPLPALAKGFITLGSFNNSMKITPATVALWSEILHNLPDARLLLKSPLFTDEGIRARYRDLFTAHGIAAARLELLAAVRDPRDHLALYGRVDIALDSFPYNGTTTTCEALWMGCPVVTLAGDRHAGRVGASLLTAAGLREWIAEDATAYKGIVRDLASDTARLAKLRQDLRGRIQASPLCDAPAFAADFEKALRAALAARPAPA